MAVPQRSHRPFLRPCFIGPSARLLGFAATSFAWPITSLHGLATLFVCEVARVDPQGRRNAIAAGRHARCPVVTASIDKLDFHRPVPVGGVITLLASVNFAGRTSMEVGVKVYHEDRASGMREHVVSAYLTFVALDKATGLPCPIPRIVPQTDEQKRRFEEGRRRREHC